MGYDMLQTITVQIDTLCNKKCSYLCNVIKCKVTGNCLNLCQTESIQGRRKPLRFFHIIHNIKPQ